MADLIPVGDPATPDLDTLQLREPPMPTVPVQVDGVVRVQLVPAPRSAVETFPMNTTQQRVLGADPKRSRAYLVATVAWNYARTKSGATAPIPANVPVTVTHADEVYASVPTSTGNLAVITEYWAD